MHSPYLLHPRIPMPTSLCIPHVMLRSGELEFCARHGCLGVTWPLVGFQFNLPFRMSFLRCQTFLRIPSTGGRMALRRFAVDPGGAVSSLTYDNVEEREQEERTPFDINLAVVLAGFAFESYNTPPENIGAREMDAFDCETVFLTEKFLHEVYDGQLLIQLKRGCQFPGLDLWGTSDPYVTLRIEDCVVRSKTIWATKDPVWNESFSVNVQNPRSKYLQIAAWDANIVTSHRRMGNTGVGLEFLCDGRRHEICVELEGMGGGGIIYLEVQYKTFSQIDSEKGGWKIPLLSDFLMGKGLESALKDLFGIDGIKARDFVMSAIGTYQSISRNGKNQFQDVSDVSQGKDTNAAFRENNINTNLEVISDIEVGCKNNEKGNVESKEGPADSRKVIDKTDKILERQHEERLETEKQVDSCKDLDHEWVFLGNLFDGIYKTLETVSKSDVVSPVFEPVSWGANDLIKRLGLKSQTKAIANYVESGLAIPMTDSCQSTSFSASNFRSSVEDTKHAALGMLRQSDKFTLPKDDTSESETSLGIESIVSQEEVKKVCMDLLRMTEEILGSWAMLAASFAGQRKGTMVESDKERGVRTSAIIMERESETSRRLQSEWKESSGEKIYSNEEMQDLSKMFKTAESAMEAWAMLATSLRCTSFVKSEFEKICFLENKRTDTQVCIWCDARHHRLIVAFRGTEQVKWKDLRTDLMLLPTGFNPERVAGDFKEEVMVHSGFLSAYDSVRSRLMSLIRTSVSSSACELNTSPKWHVYITGHSLGGALATLFALELNSSQICRDGYLKVTMYNFGSPRVGNKKFAQQYNKKVKDSWRIINHRDIIPTVPRLMGYCHVAQPIYLTAGDLQDATVSMELLEDDYQGDVIGEATPDFIVEEFMKGEKQLIQNIFKTEINMLRALRDGSALKQHMEDFYYISLLELSSPMSADKSLSSKETL